MAKLTPEELQALSAEIKAPVRDGSKIRHKLLLRLLAKGRKERIHHEPFEYEYFSYSLGSLTIYNEILKRTGEHTCWVHAYSGDAPSGEQGDVNLAAIDRRTDVNIMTSDEFEEARRLNWPKTPPQHTAPEESVTEE